MSLIEIEEESLLPNQNTIEQIEHGKILKRDEKILKAKEFLNVLTDMILSYSQSVDKKSA